MTNIIFALSLCRKAGALVTGFDAVKESVIKGKAYMVLTAADLSEKSLRRVLFYCEDLTDVYIMDKTQAELLPICKKPTGVFAVTSEELSRLCMNNLSRKTPAKPQEEYND